ncbi:MAG TPA: hypothetical protein VMY34_09780 [Acidimicrobiales bacterium]|nr:hypothetical protein [Acidimicrobiales bacterium]
MRRLVVLVATAALVLGACGSGEDRPGQVTSESDGGSGSGSGSASGPGAGDHGMDGGSLKPADFSKSQADSVLKVGLASYAFTDVPATTKGPKVFIEATNDEGTEHELAIEKDGEELIEIEAFKKGIETLAVELEPGEYSLVCHVKEGAKTHEELGMKAAFTVTA